MVTLPPWQKVVGPEAVAVATGKGFTTIVIGEEEAVQPFASVTCSTTVPELFTLMAWEVCPEGNQKFPIPDGAVKVTEPPWQNVSEPEGVIFAGGGGFTITCVTVEVAAHPPLLTVTV